LLSSLEDIMKQSSNEKYTIAWFKLAEFVSRGEKERALALYRLLAHSFEDRALVVQLEGDLCTSFNDPSAHEKYLRAAQLYASDKRWWHAAALYEQLYGMDQNNLDYLIALLTVYKQLQSKEQSFSASRRLTLALIRDNRDISDLLPIAQETLDYGLQLSDAKKLDQFIKEIQVEHHQLYIHLSSYLTS
jgi:hypothetical protein